MCDIVDGLLVGVSCYPGRARPPASLTTRHGPGLVLSSGPRSAGAGGSGDSESELSVISSNKTCMMYPHVSLLRETKGSKWNLRG